MDGGRLGKEVDEDEDEDEDGALVFLEAASSAECESKKLVMGAWKRRRLLLDSMVMVGGIGEVERALRRL